MDESIMFQSLTVPPISPATWAVVRFSMGVVAGCREPLSGSTVDGYAKHLGQNHVRVQVGQLRGSQAPGRSAHRPRKPS